MFEHPRNVNSLFGLEDVCMDFMGAFNSSRLHHAWLICGNKGIGKATLAYNLAKFLLSNPSNGDSQIRFDPNSDTVRKIENLSHPDLMVLESDSDDSKTAIKVEDVREIGKFLSLTSVESRYRVVIIDSMNDMNASSANALLKMLEEPSPNVFFLLVCHQLGQILPTVRSRCRLLKMSTPSKETFNKVITQKLTNLSSSDIEELYELSGGSYNKISMFLDGDKLDLYRRVSEILSQPNPPKSAIFELAQLASDYENWQIISFVIATTMQNSIKQKTLTGSWDIEKDLEKFTQTKKLIADSNQFHLDKSHIVTTLLS